LDSGIPQGRLQDQPAVTPLGRRIAGTSDKRKLFVEVGKITTSLRCTF
jgi:hypothetical protein